MLPREPLTKKAEAGIKKYAEIRCANLPYLSFLVEFTLKAERMRRVELYAWLEGRGQRWDAVGLEWRKKVGEQGSRGAGVQEGKER